MASVWGYTASGISDKLKCWIRGANGAGDTVIGLIGPATSKELQCNWTSPFEGDSLGEKFQKAGGVLQAGFGTTMITSFNSRQIWGGNRPYVFNLELQLMAFTDTEREVMGAIRALEKMAAPDVKGWVPLSLSSGSLMGRTPDPVLVNMGRLVMYDNLVNESLSVPFSGRIAKDGGLTQATVNLSLSTIEMLNRDQVK